MGDIRLRELVEQYMTAFERADSGAIRGDRIAAVTSFIDAGQFASFGLPATLPRRPGDEFGR